MTATTTERLQVFTPRYESERTRQALYEAAKIFDLTVDALTGSRGPLGYRLNVTVTGAPEQIESLGRLFEGDGWFGGGGSNIADFLLNPILAALFGDSQRSIASRVRGRKLERQAVLPLGLDARCRRLAASGLIEGRLRRHRR